MQLIKLAVAALAMQFPQTTAAPINRYAFPQNSSDIDSRVDIEPRAPGDAHPLPLDTFPGGSFDDTIRHHGRGARLLEPHWGVGPDAAWRLVPDPGKDEEAVHEVSPQMRHGELSRSTRSASLMTRETLARVYNHEEVTALRTTQANVRRDFILEHVPDDGSRESSRSATFYVVRNHWVRFVKIINAHFRELAALELDVLDRLTDPPVSSEITAWSSQDIEQTRAAYLLDPVHKIELMDEAAQAAMEVWANT